MMPESKKMSEVTKLFHAYRLVDVFEKTTPEIRNGIISLWARNKALPQETNPEQRAKQVALVALDAHGETVGVTTVFQDTLSRLGIAAPDSGRYYFYRMFIQPTSRVPELMRAMTNTTYDLLCAHRTAERLTGMVFISENQKLMRRAMRRKLLDHGYEFIGQTKNGQDIVRRLFKN